MDDQCRLRVDNDFVAMHLAKAALIDLSIATHNRVFAFRNRDRLRLAVSIEDDDDVLPRIATGMVFQNEAHKTEPTPGPSPGGRGERNSRCLRTNSALPNRKAG